MSFPYHRADFDENGEMKITETHMVNPSTCPHVIFVPEHYRPDGSCKCNDKNEEIMEEWGYKWSEKLERWV